MGFYCIKHKISVVVNATAQLHFNLVYGDLESIREKKNLLFFFP